MWRDCLEAAEISSSVGADYLVMVLPADFNINFSTSDSSRMRKIHYLLSGAAAPSPLASMNVKSIRHSHTSAYLS